jgi:hypothetical protein
MPPKKDLDTSSQIDKIFDEGPSDPDAEERSDDREKVLSDESTNERSPDRPAGSAASGSGASAPAEETSAGESAGSQGDSKAEPEKDRLPGPYVPKALAWDLDEAQARLRRETGEKLSQSLIIECALRICLQDYQERGSDSALVRMLRRRL